MMNIKKFIIALILGIIPLIAIKSQDDCPINEATVLARHVASAYSGSEWEVTGGNPEDYSTKKGLGIKDNLGRTLYPLTITFNESANGNTYKIYYVEKLFGIVVERTLVGVISVYTNTVILSTEITKSQYTAYYIDNLQLKPGFKYTPSTSTDYFRVKDLECPGNDNMANLKSSDIINSMNNNDTFIDNIPKISIYPNPTTGILNFEFTDDNEKTISIYNEVGTLINTLSTNSSQTNIDLSDYNKGLYIIVIKSNDQTPYIEKIVLN